MSIIAIMIFFVKLFQNMLRKKMSEIIMSQFWYREQVAQKRQEETIYVVVAKPTRFCNADCSYCSSPPLTEESIKNGEPFWSIEQFKKYFDKVYPMMVEGSYWIWHGGEPMLMGPDFYMQTYEYASEQMEKYNKQINFSMQSNLLAYNEKWKEVFNVVFGGSLSSSFDPDEYNRTVKGNPETYARMFKRSLNKILDDGFRPMVIGVYSEENADLMHKMYDWSLSLGEKGFPLRFNYCHPSGRFEGGGEAIKPETYANKLIEVYNRWIKDAPEFTITPLDQMLKKSLDIDGEGHCPWTRKCGGRFIEIEPNGDVYNCSDFADIGQQYCFGSLDDETKTLQDLLMTTPALKIKRRAVQLPVSCQNCEHYNDCEGGCMRDSVLYSHGLYGKFHYCHSWKMVFTRIKESILSGEANKILERYGLMPEEIQNRVKNKLVEYFDFNEEEINDIVLKGSKNKFGFGDNYIEMQGTNYDALGEFEKKKSTMHITSSIKDELYIPANSKLKEIKVKVLSI